MFLNPDFRFAEIGVEEAKLQNYRLFQLIVVVAMKEKSFKGSKYEKKRFYLKKDVDVIADIEIIGLFLVNISKVV